MKKWANLVTALVVIALVLWAGSRFSTVLVRVFSVVDGAMEQEGTRFIDEELDVAPTAAPVELELVDQDYDDLPMPADAPESVRPRATDYLTDGDEMLPVDETIEDLARE